MNHEVLAIGITIPDEVASLVLKTMAWRARLAAKDAVDVWRCIEVLLAAETNLGQIVGKTGETVKAELRSCVARRDGAFVAAIVGYRGLSPLGGNALHTRLRAIVDRLLLE